MKYTMSKDGKERINITVSIRLTREERKSFIDMIKAVNKFNDSNRTLKDYLNDGLYNALNTISNDHEESKRMNLINQ